MTEIQEREVPKELVEINEREQPAIQEFLRMKIDSSVMMNAASDGLIRVRGALKQTDKILQKYTKPLNDYVKMVRDEAKKTTGPLKEAEAHLSRGITSYRRTVEDARRAEELRLRKLAEERKKRAEEAGRPAPVPEELKPTVTAPPKAVVTEAGSVTFTRIPQWELEDITKVPMKYLEVNRALMTKDVKKGVPVIPGVRIWIEERPVTKGH